MIYTSNSAIFDDFYEFIVKDQIIKGAYWISSNSLFIQYCESNIGLFSIAPPLVVALTRS